jgi:POT family proton-dependent oligopeptide transporter
MITIEKPKNIEELRNFKGAYPKQLWYLFFSEMWERFCFYGMRGMLTFFMINHLFFENDQANLQYGATQAWVYAFTFIGGLFADKILGFRKSLFWGGLLMIVGSIILAINPKEFFFLGIAFNIIGTGFFKPNISSMVGQLYREDDSRRDAGFSLFYAGINIGALRGGYLCIAIGKGSMLSGLIPSHLTWNVAFGLAAVAMTISLVTFLFTQKSLADIGLSPIENKGSKWKEYAVYIGGLCSIPIIMIMVANTKYTDYFMYIIGPFSLLYLIYEMRSLKIADVKKLLAALCFILFSVIFWAIFEQAGGSLAAFSSSHVATLDLGFMVVDQNGANNAANSLFVIIFAAIVGLIWIKLAKKKLEPNGVIKFGLGFLFLGIGFLTFYAIVFTANENAVSSMNPFLMAWLAISIGELCLSPIGLSLMTKLSPQKLQGFMMGMWFLASAYGQYVAGIFGAGISPDKSDSPQVSLEKYTAGYFDFGIYAIIAGVLLLAISPLIKKLMQDIK